MTTINLPEADVLNHVLYAPYGHVPFGWHVFVITTEGWQPLMDQINWDPMEAFARTNLHHKPDSAESVGEMYFRADYVYVGMIAHECLHLGSWMCSMLRGVPKRMRLGQEPELLAEVVGELTSVTWYNLESHWTIDDH
jgi:hypothetical protein